MRQTILTILSLLVVSLAFGQESSLDLNSLRFNGIEFKTTKKEIIEHFGAGKKVETNYECGFFTNDQSSGSYYQLNYKHFVFIGSTGTRAHQRPASGTTETEK